MTITQSTRDKIGHGLLPPIWRLEIDGTDVTGNIFTTDGPALAVSMNAATAPTRKLTITERHRPAAGDGFDFTSALTAALETDPDPDRWRITVHVGYLDPEHGPQLERMGDYWLESTETTPDEVVYTLASAEVHIIGRKNYGGFATANPGLLYGLAEDAAATPTTAVQTFLADVIGRTAPAADPWTLNVVDPPTVSAGGVEDFNTEWGIDVWDSLVHSATYARRRLIPADAGIWQLVADTRTAGPIRATFDTGPAGNVTTYTETWRPRDRIDAVGAAWTVTNAATGGDQLMDMTFPRDYEIGTALPYARTTSLPRESTALLALEVAETMHGALSPEPRAVTLDAPAMPWLRPEDTVTVIRNGVTTAYFVSTITFDPIAGTMSLTTRSI